MADPRAGSVRLTTKGQIGLVILAAQLARDVLQLGESDDVTLNRLNLKAVAERFTAVAKHIDDPAQRQA